MEVSSVFASPVAASSAARTASSPACAARSARRRCLRPCAGQRNAPSEQLSMFARQALDTLDTRHHCARHTDGCTSRPGPIECSESAVLSAMASSLITVMQPLRGASCHVDS